MNIEEQVRTLRRNVAGGVHDRDDPAYQRTVDTITAEAARQYNDEAAVLLENALSMGAFLAATDLPETYEAMDADGYDWATAGRRDVAEEVRQRWGLDAEAVDHYHMLRKALSNPTETDVEALQESHPNVAEAYEDVMETLDDITTDEVDR